MINKDYILRMAEQFGRALALILHLREFDRHEEALIYIDDLLLKSTGLTSRFINSLPEEMLVRSLAPLGILNIEACLWIAVMLKAEGEIYEEKGDSTQSYYRYLKSLYLHLEVLMHENLANDANFYIDTMELLKRLEDYELPDTLKSKLFTFYEHTGKYAKAEDILFELLEIDPPIYGLIERGEAFYKRLLVKSDTDLTEGNLSREEVEEGQKQIQQIKQA